MNHNRFSPIMNGNDEPLSFSQIAKEAQKKESEKMFSSSDEEETQGFTQLLNDLEKSKQKFEKDINSNEIVTSSHDSDFEEVIQGIQKTKSIFKNSGTESVQNTVLGFRKPLPSSQGISASVNKTASAPTKKIGAFKPVFKTGLSQTSRKPKAGAFKPPQLMSQNQSQLSQILKTTHAPKRNLPLKSATILPKKKLNSQALPNEKKSHDLQTNSVKTEVEDIEEKVPIDQLEKETEREKDTGAMIDKTIEKSKNIEVRNGAKEKKPVDELPPNVQTKEVEMNKVTKGRESKSATKEKAKPDQSNEANSNSKEEKEKETDKSVDHNKHTDKIEKKIKPTKPNNIFDKVCKETKNKGKKVKKTSVTTEKVSEAIQSAIAPVTNDVDKATPPEVINPTIASPISSERSKSPQPDHVTECEASAEDPPNLDDSGNVEDCSEDNLSRNTFDTADLDETNESAPTEIEGNWKPCPKSVKKKAMKRLLFGAEKERNSVPKKSRLEEVARKKLHMFSLQDRTPADVWAQCDICDKYRQMPPHTDPALLPKSWTCDMMEGDVSCDDPGYQFEDDNEDTYLTDAYNLGSLVWVAKCGVFYPAMVDDDPDTDTYLWLPIYSTTPNWYHVTYFGDTVSREWVRAATVQPFFAANDIKTIKHKKEVSGSFSLRKAIDQAEEAIKLSIIERRKKYCFAKRFKGTWDQSTGAKKTFKKSDKLNPSKKK